MFNKDFSPHMHKEKGKKKKHGIIEYPDIIEHYSIHETIGEGAFSIVKIAIDENTKQKYACKIVPLKMLDEKNLYARFELELRISQTMRNPGVSVTTDILKDEHNYYVFMEYYPNGNLLNYIVHKKKLDENEAKVLIYQIFDSLEFIHKQKVCHRDLKPENILIDPKGNLRISDFGLSNFVGKHNLVKTPCGSPCYVSPECISGEKYDGLKSDVWSCGVILYAMVTGMLPWTKRKMNELFDQIRSGIFSIPNDVSTECQDLIQKLMTVNPNKRITLEQAKKHIWFSVQDAGMNAICISPSSEEIKAESFQPKSPIMENSNSSFQGVPYLSIRKVDYYFRPNIDYDYHRIFKKIKNIHAIKNYHDPNKSNVSSPQLDFEKAMSELKNSPNVTLKSRRKSLGVENVDPNAYKNNNSKLDKKYNQKICSSALNLIKKKRGEKNISQSKDNNEVFRNPHFSLSIENLQKNPKEFLKNIRKHKNQHRRITTKPESFNSFE